MMTSRSMGYHGLPVPRHVRTFLRPRYGELAASLAQYAAQQGIQANSAAELMEILPFTRDQRGQGGPAFGPPSQAGGNPRGSFRGGGVGMDYGY